MLKFLTLTALILVVNAAIPNPPQNFPYNIPNHPQNFPYNNGHFPTYPYPGARHPYQLGRNAPVLRQDYNIYPDGHYDWAYQTGNGIFAQEQGALRYQRGPEPSNYVQGSFAYTSPEGIPISLSYTADENGFHPRGAHLPTPPPIPPAIQRSLAWNAAHPQLRTQRYK